MICNEYLTHCLEDTTGDKHKDMKRSFLIRKETTLKFVNFVYNPAEAVISLSHLLKSGKHHIYCTAICV
jgi:hypothetical protein